MSHTFHIFAEQDFDLVCRDQLEQLKSRIRSEDKNYLLNVNRTEYLDHIVSDFEISPLGLDFDGMSVSNSEQMIPAEQFPAQAVVVALYRLAGIRSVEIGSLMFGAGGAKTGMELVRLAIPRRVYTQSHIDYVVEAVVELHKQRDRLRGLRIINEPSSLRHFTARLVELETADGATENPLRRTRPESLVP